MNQEWMRLQHNNIIQNIQAQMGLFYSAMNYFKSFYTTPPPAIALNQTKITVSVNKLIHTLRYKQLKIQREAKQLQSNLLVIVNGMKATRSVAGELQLMEMIVKKSQLVAAYEEIIRCANIIKNQARILEQDSTKVSQACVIAICTIIYAYKALQLSESINLNDFVPEPHPQINKKQISPELRQYIQLKEPTKFALNTYILEMCHRNQISLQKIKQAGHDFVYTPSKLQVRESKSSAMFALSLEELGLEDFELGQQKMQGNQGRLMMKQ